MNFSRNSRGITPEINIIPMIDVVLQMVIFFMLSTTFVVAPGLQVKLPKASSDVVKASERIEVHITKEGQIYLNNAVVRLPELKSTLETKARESKESVLIIHADEMARHGVVVKVMDYAKRAGLENMAIATQPEQEQKG